MWSTVKSGSGSGCNAEGSVVEVVAEDAPLGKEFSMWEGDVSFLSDGVSATKATISITMPAKDIAIEATCKLSDTVTVSDNYVVTATWEGVCDEFGTSAITVDTSKVKSDEVLKLPLLWELQTVIPSSGFGRR